MRSFKRETVILAIIIVILAFSVVVASGYTHKNLGYHLTTFNKTSWFPVLQDITINTIIGKMYLDTSSITYEFDFETFIEVDDAENHYVVSSAWVNFTSVDRKEDTYLYRDDTTINDFDYKFSFCITQLEAGDATSGTAIGLVTISTKKGNLSIIVPTPEDSTTVLVLQNGEIDYNYRLRLHCLRNGAYVGFPTSAGLFSVGTVYYSLYKRVGALVTFSVYSDSGRTSLIETLTVDTFQDALKYVEVAVSAGSATDPDDWISGYINDDYITVEVSPLGVAYTKNLLENETDVNNIAFSIMTNHNLGAGCNLTVYISDDNSTWIKQIDTDKNGFEWVKIENYTYTSLYCKFVLNSNGINNVFINDFWFTNLISGDAPPPEPEGLELMYILAAVVCVGLGALASQARKPG